MKKRHIVFISMPYTSHLPAALPIISVLVRRGHLVTCAISEQFSQKVIHAGARYLPIPALDSSGTKDRLRNLARRTLTDTAALFEEERPDLIIYDLANMAGRILAHRWGVPAIQISPNFAFSKEFLAVQFENPAAQAGALRFSEDADDFLRDCGVPSSGYLFNRERLNIYLFPTDLDPVGRAADESCVYAGRCAGEQPYLGDWRPPARDGLPTVLIITSTTYILGSDYFRVCIEALSGMPFNVVLFPGDDSKLAELQPLPKNFQHVKGTSAVKALASATLLICTGGATTVSEAMYHGVPLVMTSKDIELEELCERWARLGLGIHLKQEEVNAESLRKAVTEVTTSQQILRRVRLMQRTVQHEPGGEEVANRVEEFMERHCV
ncbi:nucleotide disphospho-sugar-binding domain-containing protein [Steroidobacter cummioxidans]|uniref:nucleotide disphospho-sugar-binding domain-containing protein n=1 Tax=Steroidobacter cummioxidans TaxID=1803913 RepID=UPI00137B2F70|nr:nucleotide disphospho-sugar-binding domain-containing protein [Steroidobacter cummioxidans]